MTRSVHSATVDLFASAEPAALSRTAAPAPARRVPPLLPSAARPRSKHLWYAVVFPELDASAEFWQRLCLKALQFTSWVSVEPPNALLLELHGSVKLFGSLPQLHADIDTAWSSLKLHAQSATAPSTLSALWFARAGKQVLIEDPGLLAGQMAQLPVACTAWEAERLHTLHTMGVTRIGELLRLPRAGVARRLGPAALNDLDTALARRPAPRRTFVPRERFRERCDFEMEIETAAYLLKALEPLCARCAQFLRERQAGVQALELKVEHRARAATRVRLGLASITSEYRRLIDVLSQKLSHLELASPALRMELVSGPLRPLSADSLDVFAPRGAGGSRDTAPQLVERLRARLGETAVYGLCSVPEHRPEAAWQRIQDLSLDPAARESIVCAGDQERPVWLLDAPAMLSASEVLELREGDLILEEGPERIESGWWDGHDVRRDYYIARRAGGTRVWVFQERASKCWYLHGVFA